MGIETRILVLFDWNNTLIDDAEIMWYAASAILRSSNKEPPSLKDFLAELAVGEGNYLPLYRSRGVDMPEEDMKIIFRNSYYLRINDIGLAPGALNALASLQKLAIPMGIITAQTQELFRPLMDKFGLWKFFDHRICLGKDKVGDKTYAIRRIVLRKFVPASKCLYVGDMPYDIRQTKDAGAVAVAYLNDVTREAIDNLVLAAKPHYVISHFRELPQLVEKILES